MKHVSVVPAAAAAVGMALCALWPNPASRAELSTRSNEPLDSRTPDCNAAQAPVEVDVALDRAVRANPAALSVLSYNVKVRSNMGGDGLASLGMQVLTPSYQSVAPLRSEVSAERLSNGQLARALLTPASLSDGFYVVRIAGAVSNGEAVEANAVDTFIRVQGRETTPVSAEEFMKEASPNGSLASGGADANVIGGVR